ncbi:hypothetical protein LTR64_006309 [Lithohypha guttulata]|uniref:uncharacterized protein n=1 Tax=Lithohypha guttulata TaxID=1690604 RepID=UPI002DDDEC75|nr:hypothetical protein LTR51_001893 [Lithohypha guttulata]
MSAKEPLVCEPEDQSTGRPATFIFLHGFGDDAEGIPLGLAQQFQFYHKLPYLRWLLPNAPRNQEASSTAWYMPKALLNALKPRVPGAEQNDETDPDDEPGILESCDTVDKLVRQETDRGIEPSRIVVGGFSQGCAVSLVWGLVGKERDNVAGVMPLSGYFPLADRIAALRKERGMSETPEKEKEKKKWFYAHGARDALVPRSLFIHGKEELGKWIDADRDLEEHLYEGMAHNTTNAELRDMLKWLSQVLPP